MDDLRVQSLHDLLEVCQVLGFLADEFAEFGIMPDSLLGLHNPISNVIWRLYDYPLPPAKSSENFHRIIRDFSRGEFEIEECLGFLAQFDAEIRLLSETRSRLTASCDYII